MTTIETDAVVAQSFSCHMSFLIVVVSPRALSTLVKPAVVCDYHLGTLRTLGRASSGVSKLDNLYTIYVDTGPVLPYR